MNGEATADTIGVDSIPRTFQDILGDFAEGWTKIKSNQYLYFKVIT